MKEVKVSLVSNYHQAKRKSNIMNSTIDASFMIPRQRLLGKVALITGGASGIGEGIVRLFHKHGAKVCIADVKDNMGNKISDSLSNTCYIHCDVSKEEDICQAVDLAVEKFGTLDIMVNNAGVMEQFNLDISNFDIEIFEKTMSINAKGTFLGMKHASRIMKPLMKGTIISTCSLASVMGGLGPHAYTASKNAIVGLTKNVAAELGKYGIRVNCVSPFGVPTGIGMPEEMKTEEAIAGTAAFIKSVANLKGVDMNVEDVANAIVFLASDEAKCISGVNLVIDGGFSCANQAFNSLFT